MNTKLAELYAQTLRDLARANEDVIRLTERKALLEEVGAGDHPTYQTPVKAKGRGKAVNSGSRAPRGAVEGAILNVLKPGKGLVNAEVRAELKARKYKHSLHPLHMGKALNRLTAKGKAVKTTVGNRVEYRLASQ